jgi:hypothetical protein
LTGNGATTIAEFKNAGSLQLNQYGSGTFTGTATQRLGVDSSGNVIEIPIGSGAVDGSGTANYVTKWSDADTITDSVIYDNGTDVGIGTTNPGAKLDIIKSSLSEMFRLSNTEANATTKYGAILGRHYTNAEENVTGMLITSTSSATGGTVSIGGGISAANAANNVLFYTAANNTTLTGTERMRITPSGNVGIGTTSPGAPLDVAFADNSSPQRWSYGPSEANYFLELDTNIPTGSVVTYNFNVKNNGTTYNNNLVLDRGNVGIGTDNPTATLDINAQRGAATNLASSKTAAGFDLNSNTVGGTNSLTIGETNQGSYFLQHANSAGTTAYNLALNPYGGNVGIGTDSPGAKLEVQGYISSSNNLGSPSSGANINMVYGGGIGYITSYDYNNSVYKPLYLRGSTTVLGLSGNVGIGTTSPNNILSIRQFNTSTATTLELTNTSTGGNTTKSAQLLFMLTDTVGTVKNAAYVKSVPDNTNVIDASLTFATRQADISPTEHMRITSAGNVGIGTISPSTKLHIEGSLKQQNKAYYNTIQSVGTLGTVKWTLQDSNGSNVTTSSTNKVYRVQLVTTGTGTNTGATWLASNVDAAGWSVSIVTANVSSGSNYPYMIVDTDGLPKVTTSHPNNYNVSISVEEFDGNNNGTTTGVFGLDEYIAAIGGNVGIGTTNPGYKLDVNGTLHSSNITLADGIYHEGDTNTYINFLSDTIQMATAGSVRAYINSSGNVGIGTTSPTTKLQVYNSTEGQYMEIGAGDGGGRSLVFTSSNNNGSAGALHTINAKSISGAIALATAGSERMRITSAGGISFGSTGTAYGTSGQILKSNANASPTWVDASTVIGGPYLPLAGGTMTGTNGVLFPDNFKLNIGTGSDLQIYHDGSNSYINESGTGRLILSGGSDIQLQSPAGELMADFNSNGSVDLYYDNSKKFETTSTGATVTGAATATTFLGDLNGTINTVTTAVTKANSTNDTTVATTAFVQNLIGTIPAGLVFQGTWNADTNTPTLTSGTGTTGNFYIVSVDGSTNLDGITDWKVGDWAVFVEQGASDQWEKVDNSSVLDGSGTGQTVALWSGSGTSNTLTDAPITVSGNNTTFAGNVSLTGGSLSISGDGSNAVTLTESGNGDWDD